MSFTIDPGTERLTDGWWCLKGWTRANCQFVGRAFPMGDHIACGPQVPPPTDCDKCGFSDDGTREHAIAHRDFHVMAVTNTPADEIVELDRAIERRRTTWNTPR